jgi:predicted  nucleic acid-binding Zn-ribbon protein
VDVDTVLANVQERDKWRRRLEVLQSALADVRDRQVRVAARIRRLKHELARVQELSEALPNAGRREIPPSQRINAATRPNFPAR